MDRDTSPFLNNHNRSSSDGMMPPSPPSRLPPPTPEEVQYGYGNDRNQNNYNNDHSNFDDQMRLPYSEGRSHEFNRATHYSSNEVDPDWGLSRLAAGATSSSSSASSSAFSSSLNNNSNSPPSSDYHYQHQHHDGPPPPPYSSSSLYPNLESYHDNSNQNLYPPPLNNRNADQEPYNPYNNNNNNNNYNPNNNMNNNSNRGADFSNRYISNSTTQLDLIIEGAVIACHSLFQTIFNTKVWNIYRQYAIKIFMATVLVFILLHLGTIPLRIFFTIVSIISFGRISLWDTLHSFNGFIWALCAFLPFAMLLFLRYIYTGPLNQLLFATLDTLDPPLATRLRAIPHSSFNYSLRRVVYRYIKYFAVMIVGLWLSYIPLFGSSIVVMLQFAAIASTVGIKVAFILGCISLLPFFNTLGLSVLTVFLWSKALSQELLFPYWERIRLERENGRYPPESANVSFTKAQQNALSIGFCVPFALIIHGTAYGWLIFGVAQATVSWLIVEIERRSYK